MNKETVPVFQMKLDSSMHILFGNSS